MASPYRAPSGAFRRPLVALLVSVVALSVVTTALIGCSKKESPSVSAASGLPESDFFDRLPKTTFAFLFQETRSPAYREYSTSSFFQAPDAYVDKIAELSKDLPEIKRLNAIVNGSPAFKDAAGKIQPPLEFMLFAAADDDGSGAPEFGAYTRSARELDPATHLSALEASLKAEQLTSERRQFGSAQGLVISDSSGAANPPLKFYLVVSADLMSISSSAAVAERLFVPLDSIALHDRGRAALDANQVFQRVRARAANTRGIFTYGFFDAVAGLKIIEGAVPAGAAPVDAAQFHKSFESLAFARTSSDGLSDYLWIGLPAGAVTPEVEKVLGGGGAHPGIQRIVPGAVLATSIDGAVAKAIKAVTLPPPGDGTQAPSMPFIDSLDALQGVTLAVRNASGASPFPELVLELTSSDAPRLKESLKVALGALSAGGGLPLGSWQSKKVGGIDVDFMASPIGIGIFLAATRNGIVVSTSEGVFADIERGAFAKEVPARFEHQAFAEDKAPLVLGFLSGQRLAALIESVQTSLAMFTGGQSLVDQPTLESVRALGSIGMAATYRDGAVRLHHHYEVEKPTK